MVENDFPAWDSAGVGGERFGRETASDAGVEYTEMGVIVVEAMGSHGKKSNIGVCGNNLGEMERKNWDREKI